MKFYGVLPSGSVKHRRGG